MAKPQAPAAAAQAQAIPRAAKKSRPRKHDPSVIAPLPLYSVFLLGAFAMKPGPARGAK
jgi:hypothetical protein